MGCCSPNYRKIVNEEEEKVNAKGKESIPLFAKIVFSIIIISGIVVFAILL